VTVTLSFDIDLYAQFPLGTKLTSFRNAIVWFRSFLFWCNCCFISTLSKCVSRLLFVARIICIQL